MAYKVFKGTTTGTEVSERMAGDNVASFIITNKGGGTITLNLRILGDVNVNVAPLDLQLATGESYTDKHLVLLDREQIELSVSGGTVDYYFAIAQYGNNS